MGLLPHWGVRFAHLGALLSLWGLSGTIGRLSELISRPGEARALLRQSLIPGQLKTLCALNRGPHTQSQTAVII